MKPTLVLMSGRTVAFAATFLIPVVLARIFSQAEFGTYKQLFLIYSTLYSLAQFGMAESLFYFLPSATARQSGRYVANSMICLAAAGLTCLVLLRENGPRIASWLNNAELSTYMTAIGVFVSLTMISNVLEITLIARGRYGLASSYYALSDVLRAGFFLTPAILFRRLDAMLAGAAAFAALRLAGTSVCLVSELGGELRPAAAALKRQLTYAVPFGAAGLLEIVQSTFHQYAVAFRFDAATFAIYSVGCLQIPFVDLVVMSAGNVMMVRMRERLGEGRRDAALEIWRETFRTLALILVPVVGLLLVLARPLMIFLFTERYASSAPIFMIWSVTILLATLMTDATLRVYAATRFLLLLNAIRLVLIVSLIHWSMATFHLAGAVLVTIFAGVVSKAVGLARIARLMQVSLASLVPWHMLGGLTVATALAALAGRVVVVGAFGVRSPLLTIMLATAVYAGVYLAALWRSALLTAGERLAVAIWLRRWAAPIVPGYADQSTAPVVPPAAVGGP